MSADSTPDTLDESLPIVRAYRAIEAIDEDGVFWNKANVLNEIERIYEEDCVDE